jgi:uncharacterized protein DUF4271
VVVFVFIKTGFAELADQYLLLYRTFSIKTIDETIYKINYLSTPNIFFIGFISMIYGFVIMAYMYFYPGELSIFGINPSVINFWGLVVNWSIISLIFLIIIILKYLLTLLASSIFALKIASIHFASSLRLLLPLAIFLLILTFVQYAMVGVVPHSFYWGTLIVSIIILELILFLKLTLVTSHTLLYIIVYLCATEIIPIVLLLKLITE